MIIVSPDVLRALLRGDFCSFIQRSFLELNAQSKLSINWHLELIAAKLDAVRRGEILRLIIMVPPRHLKSICASVSFPAWLLGHDPTKQIICVSYAQDLADKLARDCRAVMTAPFYQSLSPGARLAGGKQSVQEFTTAANGFRMATSIGGVLTGRGADVIVIDDPLKPDEALSVTRRNAVNQWFDNSLYSRLNDKVKGAIVIIMQRLHEDDLVGHVLEQAHWEVIRLPAIAEETETIEFSTPAGRRRIIRSPGDLLHPERESQAVLDDIRERMGEYNLTGQYQQSPTPLGGGLVKREWLKSYQPSSVIFDRVVQSWDTAVKVTELSDYSVCTTWGIKGQEAYLVDVIRARLEFPALRRFVEDHWRRFNAQVVLIEDKASGSQLFQDLRFANLHAAKGVIPDGDKIMRMHAQSAMIENGFVFLPETAPWLSVYLHELTTFPACKHDDQTDSTSQFLNWFKEANQRRRARQVFIPFMGR